MKPHNVQDWLFPDKLNVFSLPAKYRAINPKLANATEKSIINIFEKRSVVLIIYFFIYLHDECPLGNDFFPSLTSSGSPVQSNSIFEM